MLPKLLWSGRRVGRQSRAIVEVKVAAETSLVAIRVAAVVALTARRFRGFALKSLSEGAESLSSFSSW